MTFDALLDVMQSFVGKMAEVIIDMPTLDDREGVGVASFAGTVGEVREGGAGGLPCWRIWFVENPGPGAPILTLDQTLYVDADFEADHNEEDYMVGEHGPEDRTGLSWTLRIRHTGYNTTITVYL